ncbi:SAG-related sequence [Besnoitia besnoiti]|uniref:SAG-related sequence n=1 Tax=Besnoitia besnoiti TaxID=94643 RepID=A0A2A9M3D8_BESBE|nr:SAG-related sequence [Besnoitia besnoiti]PFH32475.1 SAG-related sequence [Besnoitia besnoiti]
MAPELVVSRARVPPVRAGPSVRRVVSKSSRTSRVGQAFLAFIAVMPALAYYAPVWVRGDVGESTASTCTDVNKRALCSCAANDMNNKPLPVTLSQTKNELQLLCSDPLQYVPAGLSKSQVCPADADKLTQCLTDQGTGYIDIATVLHGNPKDMEWKTESKAGEGSPKVLTIPQTSFPYDDEFFVVGCSSHSRDTSSKCQVNVTVAARKTTKHEQTVTCAYGQASNQSHQQITITPSHNAFTLTCGDQGEVLPTLHTQTYCIIGEKTDAEAKCSGSYADVLPGYEETWWKAGNSKNSFTLTIPTDKFPKESATIMVGCGKAKTSTSERIEPESALSPSVCSVDVTIEGSGVASASSLAFTGLTAALSGTVTITALWVDSL